MARRAARRDANHAELVEKLRKFPGVTVADTADLGGGFPDIVIGIQGLNILCEIKDGEKPPSERKLTEKEQEFFDTWKGQVEVIKDLPSAVKVITKHLNRAAIYTWP